jgi:hypothetical protein
MSAPVAGITGSKLLCAGSTGILAATPAGLKYEWMRNGQLLSDDTGEFLMVSDSGIYGVVVSSALGCSDSAFQRVSIDSFALAVRINDDSITKWGKALTASGGISYHWSNSSRDSTIYILNAGMYSVTVMDSNGCSFDTTLHESLGCGDTELIIVLNGGKPFTIDGIIPNPATSSFTVSFSNPGISPIHYEIVDVLGRILASGETTESQLSLSASDLPAGVLLLRASSNGFVQTRQFVVVK